MEGYAEVVRKLLEDGSVTGVSSSSEGFVAQCPFHDERTPSFAINETTGFWRCYGCKEKGNLTQLYARLLNTPYRDAARHLQQFETRGSFPTLTDKRPGKQVDPVLDDRMLIPLLAKCPRYLLDRGYAKELLRRYEVGYDAAEMRVVFPVRNVTGGLVGLTRRATLKHQEPKYRHTVFHKSDHLYLGWQAAQAATEDKMSLIFVEGHTDALRVNALLDADESTLRMRLAKLPPCAGAVGVMGSSLSVTQAKLAVRRMKCTTAIFAFDNDEAGTTCLEGNEKQRAARDREVERGLPWKPCGAVEALLSSGVRSMYRVSFREKDPGDWTPESKLRFKEIE